jgi:Zn-dependent alcohol dehydrogenase
MKIKAAVLREMGKSRPYTKSKPLKIEEVKLDEPGHNEVLVKVCAAGLCHSDLSVIDGNRPRQMPMVLGHEAAGRVVSLGPGVKGLEIGDHVVFTFMPCCGYCLPCITARPALCTNGSAANNAGVLLDGGIRLTDKYGEKIHHHVGVSGFAEYTVSSRQSLVKIDKELSWDIAALFGCAVITGVGAVMNTAGLSAGQTVLITGLGGIGFAAMLGALAAGASQVVAADINPEKLRKAKEFGAHFTVDCADDNAVDQVKEITGGGVDIGLECAGVVQALDFTYQATCRGGKTVTVGLPHPGKRMEISPVHLVAEERTLQGSYLGSCVPGRDIPDFIALFRAGRLPVERLMTHKLTLDEIYEGFERLARGEAIRQVILID